MTKPRERGKPSLALAAAVETLPFLIETSLLSCRYLLAGEQKSLVLIREATTLMAFLVA